MASLFERKINDDILLRVCIVLKPRFIAYMALTSKTLNQCLQPLLRRHVSLFLPHYDDLGKDLQKESNHAGIRALQLMGSSVERAKHVRHLSLIIRPSGIHERYGSRSRNFVDIIFEVLSKLPSLRVLKIVDAITCKALNHFYASFITKRGLNEYPTFKQLTVLHWDSFWERDDEYVDFTALLPLVRSCQQTLEELIIFAPMITEDFSKLLEIILPKLRVFGIILREGFEEYCADDFKRTVRARAAAFFVNHLSLETLKIKLQTKGDLWIPEVLDPGCLPNLRSYSGVYSFFSKMIEAEVACLKSTLMHLELPSSALRHDRLQDTLQAALNRHSISGDGKPLLTALDTLEFFGDDDRIPLEEGTKGLQLWSACCGPALQNLLWFGIRLGEYNFSLTGEQLVAMVGGFKGLKSFELHNFLPLEQPGFVQVRSEVAHTTLQFLARAMPSLEEIILYYRDMTDGYATVYVIRHPIPESEEQTERVRGRDEGDRIEIRIVRHYVDSFRISPESGLSMYSYSNS